MTKIADFFRAIRTPPTAPQPGGANGTQTRWQHGLRARDARVDAHIGLHWLTSRAIERLQRDHAERPGGIRHSRPAGDTEDEPSAWCTWPKRHGAGER